MHLHGSDTFAAATTTCLVVGQKHDASTNNGTALAPAPAQPASAMDASNAANDQDLAAAALALGTLPIPSLVPLTELDPRKHAYSAVVKTGNGKADPGAPYRSFVPRFTRFSLPPRYAGLRPLARLWMQSRVVPPGYNEKGERVFWKAGSDSGDDEAAEKGEGEVGGDGKKEKTITIEAVVDEPELEPEPDWLLPRYERPWTLANVGIHIDIVRALWPRVTDGLQQRPDMVPHALVYGLSSLVSGLLPAASLWASAKLLDLVEKALNGTPAPLYVASGVAALGVLFKIGVQTQEEAIETSVRYLRENILFFLSKTALIASIDRTIERDVDQAVHALVHEVAIPGDFTSTINGRGGWRMFTESMTAVTQAIEIVSQIYLMFVTLSGADSGGGWWLPGRGPNWTLVGLTALSFAPSIIDSCEDPILDWFNFQETDWAIINSSERTQEVMRRFMHSNETKQELVLFGLRDWIIERWTAARKYTMRFELDRGVLHDAARNVLASTEEIVQTLFYVLLATHIVPTTLTLGGIHLHQNIGKQLLSAVQSLHGTIDNMFQLPFFLATTFIAYEDDSLIPQLCDLDGKRVDYESHRSEGGMVIEASGLSFTYPGAGKPAVRSVDLTVHAGETLAIVGWNGSGKSTFVKTLLGLNDYSGGLRINGVEVRKYDPKSLHARMSCLFQDFMRYHLSIRDNVGLGDTRVLMGEMQGTAEADAEIMAAVEKGGATAVVEENGLKCVVSARPAVVGEQGVGEVGMRMTMSKQRKEDERERVSGESEKEDEEGEEREEVEVVVLDEAGDMGDPEIDNNSESTADNTANVNDDAASSAGSDNDSEVSGWGWGGAGLSGGQWQRLALARAFMRAGSADLVVFDEPSSALDPLAEAELFDRIHALSTADGGRSVTTIFISHRFNTVRKADRIAFVDGGRIIELGTHAELMALKGKYHECFTLQRRGFEED